MALISKDKRKWATIRNKYGITEKDLVGELTGFPLGIAIKMLEEQEKQGNKPNIKVFQHNIRAYKSMGGFSWNDAKDGFWGDILILNDFDEFYKKYPEYKKI